jgi:hypothetical protein
MDNPETQATLDTQDTERKPTKHSTTQQTESLCVYRVFQSAVICFLCCVVLCFVGFRSVSCVSNVACVSGLSILDCPSVFSNVYLSCVLCVQNVACVSVLSIPDCPFGFL